MPHRELHPAERRVLPCRVRVEAEEELLRHSPELAELAFGERRAHRRHDRLESGLAKRDDVRVPLDDRREVLLADRRLREMEPVQNRSLVEEVAFGRVHVLAAERVVLAELPRLEADDAAARVGERKHEALREVVGTAHGDEPGGLELVEREPALLRLLREPLAGSEPEPELLCDLLAEAATGEVLAHGGARFAVPEEALEVACGLVEHGVHALAPAPLRLDARRCVLDLDRDAEPLREPLDRADEVEVLGLAHERDDVAALPAAEAVVELLDRVDGERRRLLLVERAAAGETRSGGSSELRRPETTSTMSAAATTSRTEESLMRATG